MCKYSNNVQMATLDWRSYQQYQSNILGVPECVYTILEATGNCRRL